MVVVIAKLIDMGIAPNIFREFSINKNLELLNTGFLIRIISFIVFAAIYNLICLVLSVNKQEILLSNIFLFNLVISSKGFLRELLEIPFKVDLAVQYPIIIMLIDNILFLGLVLIMPVIKGDLTYFVLAYTFSNLPGFFIMIFLIRAKYNYRIAGNLNSAKWLIKKSFPVFVYTVFNTIYLNIDLLQLGRFDSSYSAGIYSAAYRLVIPLLIIPTAVIHTVFPQITANYHDTPAKNLPIIRIVFKIFFLLSFSLAAIVTFKADDITSFIYGYNYIVASIPLTILLWGMIFLFNSFFVINLLVAYDKQVGMYVFSIVTLAINLILNFVLIEQYSYLGVAYSKFISIAIGFIITSFIIYKIDNTIYLFEKEILFFSVMLIALIYIISSVLSLILYLIVAGILLVLVVLLTRFFKSNEIKLLLKIINKENWYKNFSFFYPD